MLRPGNSNKSCRAIALSLALGGICMSVSTSAAFAAPAAKDGAAPISASKQALLDELTTLLSPAKNAEQALNASFAEQEKQTEIVLSGMINAKAKSMPPEELAKVKEMIIGRQIKILKRTQELFKERVNLGELTTAIYDTVYNTHFTEPQLKDLVTFYKTPTGKHFIEVQPAVVSEAMALVNKKVEGELVSIAKQVESELPPPQSAAPGGAPAK